jgi:hypothetical protein
MADEGSVSAALMEIEDFAERKHLIATQRRPNPLGWRTVAAAFVVVGFAAFAWGWLKRNA